MAMVTSWLWQYERKPRIALFKIGDLNFGDSWDIATAGHFWIFYYKFLTYWTFKFTLKCPISVFLNVFESLLCSPRLHLFHQNRDDVKYFYNLK